VTEDDKPEDWTEQDDAAWAEFKRRMSANPIMNFHPQAIDLKVGPVRTRKNLELWLKAVLAPLPLDIIREFGRGIKNAGLGIFGMILGVASIVLMPIGTIVHRILLTFGAISGRLHVVPHTDSIVRHMNYRLGQVKAGMEKDGYDLSAFFRYLTPEEVSDADRAHILRRYRSEPSNQDQST
jgi:hypothetical protein